MSSTTEPYAISIAEAADRLGVSKSYLYQLAKEGRLPVVRLGRRVLVPVESLQGLLAV
jgi:excisionase family DNA binding protein